MGTLLKFTLCVSALALAGVSAWTLAIAGSLDASAPPAPTMKTLDQVTPIWDRLLLANDGPDSCHSSRFTCVMNNNAVRDNETGLVWLRNFAALGNFKWEDARMACATSFFSGIDRGGWRLPTLTEVMTIPDPFAGGLPPGHPFTNVGGFFWTTTTDSGSTANAWQVNLIGPIPNKTDKNITAGTWCVRGGFSNSENSLLGF